MPRRLLIALSLAAALLAMAFPPWLTIQASARGGEIATAGPRHFLLASRAGTPYHGERLDIARLSVEVGACLVLAGLAAALSAGRRAPSGASSPSQTS